LKIWGETGDGNDFYREACKANEHKINLAMKSKDPCGFLGEEDDLDIEGDHLLRQLRQHRLELVKRGFYDGEVDD